MTCGQVTLILGDQRSLNNSTAVSFHRHLINWTVYFASVLDNLNSKEDAERRGKALIFIVEIFIPI